MSISEIEGRQVRLQLEGWGRLGEAVAHLDGHPVFVFGGIPGEEVVAEVVREGRRHTSAKVLNIVNPASYRVSPPCPYFGPCTGCQWQHIDYKSQIKLKQNIVINTMERVGGFQHPTVRETTPSPQQFGYRNHARFTIGDQGTLGFVNRESRKFVNVDECMIMNPGINAVLAKLQTHCAETTQLSVRFGVNTGDFLIQPSMNNPSIKVATGQKHYADTIRGNSFRIASPSFFQVNIQLLDQMVDMIRDGLQLSGSETIVDAYAGVGTFALLLSPYANRILAIEESASAIDDAKVNLQAFGNIELIQGRTEEIFKHLPNKLHGVVLDPPRKGCDPSVLDALNKLGPDRVVYVSCDPTTLARDLKILCDGEFHLNEIRPIDMFPQTHHIECIASLHKRKPIENIVLASSSPRRQEIMGNAGIQYTFDPPSIPEDSKERDPINLTTNLALDKAKRVATRYLSGLIVAADTVVSLDDQILGKPDQHLDAIQMLRNLRNRSHIVVTSVALLDTTSAKSWVHHCKTIVTMRDYSDREILDYVSSGKSDDKAGGYGIQDMEFNPVSHIDGCHVNVMGFPVCIFGDLLYQAGYFTHTLILPTQCLTHLQELRQTS